MSPYLLTVCDGLHKMCFGFALLLGVFLALGVAIRGIGGPDMSDPEKEALNKTIIKLSIPFGFCVLISVLVPSSEQLRNAYVMTEAAKLATAENGKLAAEEILKRIDKLIEIKQK